MQTIYLAFITLISISLSVAAISDDPLQELTEINQSFAQRQDFKTLQDSYSLNTIEFQSKNEQIQSSLHEINETHSRQLASCSSGQYFDPKYQSCQNCKPGCANCTCANDCQSCQTLYVMFYDIYQDQNSCQFCNLQNCNKCNFNPQNGAETCSQCQSGYTINTSGQCSKPVVCTSSQYYDTYYAQCKPCPTGCSNCTYNAALYSPSCASCSSGYLMNSNFSQCQKTCGSGQYFDASYLQCMSCQSSCNSCYQDPKTYQSVCTSCNSGSSLVNGQCQVVCSSNQYFDLSYQQCRSCSKNCSTCSWSQSLYTSKCSSCQSGFKYDSISNQCVLTCGNSTYYDFNQGQCVNCGTGCSACSQAYPGSITQCTSCFPGYVTAQQYGNTVCVSTNCQSTQYWDLKQNQCMNCPNACSKCAWNSSYSQPWCSSCISQNYTLTSSGQCQMNCQNGTYYDCNKLSCSSCPSGCSSCAFDQPSNQVLCNACQPGFSQIGKSNQCLDTTCSNGSYFDQVKMSCLQCPFPNCQQCNWNTNQKLPQCTMCNTNWQLNQNSGCDPAITCSSIQYFDSGSKTCQNCSTGCSSCYQPTTTTATGSVSALTSLDYDDIYEQETVVDTQNLKIVRIKTKAKQTISKVKSTLAKIESSLLSLVLPPIPQPQPQPPTSASSSSCLNPGPSSSSSSVSSTSGNTSSVCSVCSSAYTLTSSGTCQLKNTTLPTCPSYQFYNTLQLICTNCSYGCLLCPSNTTCNTCAPGYLQVGNICIGYCIIIVTTNYGTFTYGCTDQQNCSASQYYNNQTKTCSSCVKNCSSCYDNKTCAQCSSGFNLDSNYSCMQCANGTTYDSTQMKCINQNTITNVTCATNQFKDNKTNNCSNCSSGCKSCSNNLTCSVCQSQLVLLSNGTCGNSCNANQYVDNSTQSCQNCSQYCSSCNDSRPCPQCDNAFWGSQDGICNPKCTSGFTWNYNLSICEIVCKSNQYIDRSSNTCLNCTQSGCNICASTNVCQQCQTQYSLQSNGSCTLRCSGNFTWNNNTQQCVSPVVNCTSGQYLNTTSNSCQSCSDQCTKCTGSNTCQNCSIGYNATNGICQQNCIQNKTFWDNATQRCSNYLVCGQGSFLNSYVNLCSNCSTGCLNCTSQNSCQQCSDQYTLQNIGVCLLKCQDNTTQWNSTSQTCQNKEKCNSNQFLNISTQQCNNCSANCSTCAGQNNCTQCVDQSFNLTQGVCSYKCQNGQTFNQSSSQCQSQCQAQQQWNSSNSSCQNITCIASQYFNTSTQKCSNCSQYCSSCVDSRPCPQCDDAFWGSQNGTCNPKCTNGYQWNYNLSICEIICQSSQYIDRPTNTCQNCTQSGCQICAALNVCQQCKTQYSLKSNGSCALICLANSTWNYDTQRCVTTVVNCTSGQYLNTTSNSCQNCSAGCSNCSNSSICVACDQDKTLQQTTNKVNSCVLRCPDVSTIWNNDKQTCQNKCNSTSYYDTGSSSCKQCSKGCTNCTSGSNCITCNTPQYSLQTYGGCIDVCQQNYTTWNNITQKCQSQCATGTYADTSGSCQLCSSNCTSCTSPYTCQSCNTPEYSMYNYTSSSWTNTTDNSSKLQCLEVCLFNGTVFIKSDTGSGCQNKSVCASSQYLDSKTNKCFNCSSNCTQCSSSAYCNQCNGPQYVIKVANSSYVSCVDTCQQNGTIWSASTNKCVSSQNCSPSGQYYNTTANICSNCSANCTSCSNSTTCSSCQYHFQVQNGQCVDSCAQNGTTWIAAHNQCETKLNCSSAQFYNSTTNQCLNCTANCASCENGATCKSCQYHFTYQNSQCVDSCSLNGTTWIAAHNKCESTSTCNSYQYLDSVSNSCLNCSSNCLSCNSSSTCNSCSYHYSNVNNQCVDSCSLNGTIWVQQHNQCEKQASCTSQQYYDNSTNSCLNCSSNCVQCSNSTACSSCSFHYQLQQGSCVDSCFLNGTSWIAAHNQCESISSCSSNQFYNSASNNCTNCSSNCLSCNSSSTCTQCSYHYQRTTNGSCIDSCSLNGTIWVQSHNQCEQQAKCSSTQYYDTSSNSCFNCSSNCSTCTSANTCSSCPYHYSLQQGQCLDSCSLNGTIWVQAHNMCESKASCSSSQFYNSTINTCSNCSGNCSQCTDSNTCTTCGYHFTLQKGSCVDSCSLNSTIWVAQDNQCESQASCSSSQYYDSPSNTCNNCSSNCASCSSSSQCNQCSYHYTLKASSCVDSCSLNSTIWVTYYNQCQVQAQCATSGQYYNSTLNQCLNCSLGCYSCTQDNYCAVCKTPQYLVNSNGGCSDVCALNGTTWVSADQRCESTCGSAQYFDLTANQCVNCQSGCTSCTSSTKCSQCDATMTLLSNGTCQSKCSSTSFYDTSSSSCKTCTSPCATCSSSSQCLSCITAQYSLLSNGSCADACALNDTVWNNDTQQCSPKTNPPLFSVTPASSSILRCRNTTVSLSIISGFPLNLMVSSAWSFSITNSNTLASSSQLSANLTALASKYQNKLSLTIPSTLTEWITSEADLIVSVTVSNNNGIYAVNTTKITLSPTVITKVTNYSSSYSVDASSGLTIYPAFLYTECPDITTAQALPSGVDINCALYDSSSKFVKSLTSCSIPASLMSSNAQYSVKYSYTPNIYQSALSDTIAISTNAGISLGLQLKDDAVSGYISSTVNHTINCTPSAAYTGTLTYAWSVKSSASTTALKTDGTAGVLASGSQLIVIKSFLTNVTLTIQCNASNSLYSDTVTQSYTRTQTSSTTSSSSSSKSSTSSSSSSSKSSTSSSSSKTSSSSSSNSLLSKLTQRKSTNLLESDTSIISFTNDNTTNSTGNNTSSWIANNKESMITIGILVVIVVIVIVAFAIWLIMRKLKLTSLKMPIGRYASPVQSSLKNKQVSDYTSEDNIKGDNSVFAEENVDGSPDTMIKKDFGSVTDDENSGDIQYDGGSFYKKKGQDSSFSSEQVSKNNLVEVSLFKL